MLTPERERELRARAGTLSLDEVKSLFVEIDHLKNLLYYSEQFRQAYKKGKFELYSMGGEIAEAATKCLPCSEGPLERAAIKAIGERTGWIELRDYDKLWADVKRLEALIPLSERRNQQ